MAAEQKLRYQVTSNFVTVYVEKVTFVSVFEHGYGRNWTRATLLSG
jgi:hypothetical protein